MATFTLLWWGRCSKRQWISVEKFFLTQRIFLACRILFPACLMQVFWVKSAVPPKLEILKTSSKSLYSLMIEYAEQIKDNVRSSKSHRGKILWQLNNDAMNIHRRWNCKRCWKLLPSSDTKLTHSQVTPKATVPVRYPKLSINGLVSTWLGYHLVREGTSKNLPSKIKTYN